jgi:hypothetical protein
MSFVMPEKLTSPILITHPQLSFILKNSDTKVCESESSIPQTIDEPNHIADIHDEDVESVG